MTDENSQKIAKCDSPYYLLNLIEQKAVDMKCDLYHMRIIAGQLGITYETCRNYFSEGGRLWEAWKYREIELSEDYQNSREKIMKILEEGALDAALTIRSLARKPSMVGLQASADILNRTGFRGTDKEKAAAELSEQAEAVQFYLPSNGREVLTEKT